MTTTIRKKQTRFTIAAAVAVIMAVAGGITLGWRYAPLLGWDLGAGALLGMLWLDFTGHSPSQTKAIAQRDDMNHSIIDVILVVASIASIVAVAVLLTGGSNQSGSSLLTVGFGLLSIVTSWATVHSIYMLRYAALYYKTKDGGVDFNDNNTPRFSDFAYLSFTIGMTYQVSDTSFKSPEFRSVALRHALLSFLFGTAIIATTINFIASLAK